MVFRWIKNNIIGDFEAERQKYESQRAQQTETPTKSPTSSPQRNTKRRSFSTRDFEVPIVGESHYQRELLRAKASVKSYEGISYIEAILVREPDNKFDPNAVKVMTAESQTIGYLSRENAVRYGAALALWEDIGYQVKCRAKLSAARQGKSVGAWLDLEAPEVISSTFRKQRSRQEK